MPDFRGGDVEDDNNGDGGGGGNSFHNTSPPRIVRGTMVPATDNWLPGRHGDTADHAGGMNALQDFSPRQHQHHHAQQQLRHNNDNDSDGGEMFVRLEESSTTAKHSSLKNYDVDDEHYTSFGLGVRRRHGRLEQEGRTHVQDDEAMGTTGEHSFDGLAANDEEAYDSYGSDRAVEDGRLSAQSDERAVMHGDDDEPRQTDEASSSVVDAEGKMRQGRLDAYNNHDHAHLKSKNSSTSRGLKGYGHRKCDEDTDDDLSLAFADISFSKSEQIDRLSAAMVSSSKGGDKDFASAVKKSTSMNALLDQLSRDKVAMDDTDFSVHGSDRQLQQTPSDATPVRNNVSAKKTRPSLAKRAEQAYLKRRERSSSQPPSPPPTKMSSSPKGGTENVEKALSSPSNSQHASPANIGTSRTDDVYESSSNLTKSYDSEVSVPLDEPVPARRKTNSQSQMNSPRVIVPPISASKSNGSESSNTSPRARMKAKLMAAKNHRKVTIPSSSSSPSSLPRTKPSQQTPVVTMESASISRAGAPSPFSEESYEDFLAKLQQAGAVNMNRKQDCDNSVSSDRTEKMSNVNEMEEYESIRSFRTAPSDISASSPAIDDVRMQSLSSYMVENPVPPTSETMSDESSQIEEKTTQHASISFESLASVPQASSSEPNDLLVSARLADENEQATVQPKPSEENGISEQLFSMLSNTFVDMGKMATELLEGGAAMIDDITPTLEEHNKVVQEYANSVLGIDTIGSSGPVPRISHVASDDEAVAIEVEYIEDMYGN